jgi:prolyl-tRNA editing enzyme YbaK/EbsC (Cys-tRNA(Pro) deacylase)
MPAPSTGNENSILEAIRQFLKAEGIEYREVHHPPTRTSEASARARGEPLRHGGKALLMKADDQFRLFVLPADMRLDSRRVRQELGVRRTRFATRDELLELTGLEPGSVPPFGPPILDFDLYVDSAVTENERIAFNAGSLTDSIILLVEDYLRVAAPARVMSFACAAE